MPTPTPPTPWLLAFTLGSERERDRRRLLPPALGGLETELHGCCIEQTLAAGRRAGLRIAVAAPEGVDGPGVDHRLTQRGATFGERLLAAIDDAWASLDGPLVVVGTDTPDLSAEHLTLAAVAAGADADLVALGPAADGGLYLIASARPIPELADVRWGRSDTRAQLRAALLVAGRPVFELPVLGDLDARLDLDRWLARGATGLSDLARRLRDALAHLARPLRPSVLGKPRLAPVPVPTGRAPPR